MFFDPTNQRSVPEAQIAWEEHCAQLGSALLKEGGTPEPARLSGKLYFSRSGWLLLSVPNALGIGAFKALNETGIELPLNSQGRYNAHCTIMTPEEVEKIGGPEKLWAERGKEYDYTLGPVKSVMPPEGEYGKVWYVTVSSPDVEQLRKSFGLSAKIKEHDWHITFAGRRRAVLYSNDVVKRSDEEGRRPRVDAYIQDDQGKLLAAIQPDGSVVVPGGGPPMSPERPSPLSALLLAKLESDRGNYTRKHLLVRELLRSRGGEFSVDEEEGRNLGLTHDPTGFRLHLPRVAVPAGVQLKRASSDHSQEILSTLEKFSEEFADAQEETPGGSNAMSKGWQWRYLAKEVADKQRQVLPRIFQNQHTPVSELLASPTWSAILTALAGAGLGGTAGALGAPLFGQSSAAFGAGGAAAGGLLGALRGYSQRRQENDRVIDALRRLPTGATLGEWDTLKKMEAEAGLKKAEQEKQANPLGLFRLLGGLVRGGRPAASLGGLARLEAQAAGAAPRLSSLARPAAPAALTPPPVAVPNQFAQALPAPRMPMIRPPVQPTLHPGVGPTGRPASPPAVLPTPPTLRAPAALPWQTAAPVPSRPVPQGLPQPIPSAVPTPAPRPAPATWGERLQREATDQGRRLLGADQPGALYSWKRPLRSLYNAVNQGYLPFWLPAVGRTSPGAARWLGRANMAAQVGLPAAGAYFAYQNMPGNLAANLSDQVERQFPGTGGEAYWRAVQRTPGMRDRLLLPEALGGESSALARALREGATNALPEMWRGGLHQELHEPDRDAFDRARTVGRWATATSPLGGAVQQGLTEWSRRPADRNLIERSYQDALANNLPELMSNFRQEQQSPSFRDLNYIVGGAPTVEPAEVSTRWEENGQPWGWLMTPGQRQARAFGRLTNPDEPLPASAYDYLGNRQVQSELVRSLQEGSTPNTALLRQQALNTGGLPQEILSLYQRAFPRYGLEPVMEREEALPQEMRPSNYGLSWLFNGTQSPNEPQN